MTGNGKVEKKSSNKDLAETIGSVIALVVVCVVIGLGIFAVLGLPVVLLVWLIRLVW